MGDRKHAVPLLLSPFLLVLYKVEQLWCFPAWANKSARPALAFIVRDSTISFTFLLGRNLGCHNGWDSFPRVGLSWAVDGGTILMVVDL